MAKASKRPPSGRGRSIAFCVALVMSVALVPQFSAAHTVPATHRGATTVSGHGRPAALPGGDRN